MNVTLLRQVKEEILNNPKAFDMSSWDCGTSACIAGHAARICGITVDPGINVFNRFAPSQEFFIKVKKALDLNDSQFSALCHMVHWPVNFSMKYIDKSLSSLDRAKVAADYIEFFIQSNL